MRHGKQRRPIFAFLGQDEHRTGGINSHVTLSVLTYSMWYDKSLCGWGVGFFVRAWNRTKPTPLQIHSLFLRGIGVQSVPSTPNTFGQVARGTFASTQGFANPGMRCDTRSQGICPGRDVRDEANRLARLPRW
jgi:hypothetical protein